jgi:predicted permease
MIAALARLLRRLGNTVRPGRANRELERELAAHLSFLEDGYRQQGMPVEEARRAARVALGGIAQTQERCRDEASFRALGDLRRDIGYALRVLRRNPIVTATAAISIAVGIAATSAVFTLANALLLRPPAGVALPKQLVDIGGTRDGGINPISFPTYRDIRDRTQSFSGVYARHPFIQELRTDEADDTRRGQRVRVSVVTANYFDVLGVRPARGRLFADADDAGAASLVVLSHRYWSSRFQADESVVGSALRLNGRVFTITGVAAEGFHGTAVADADAWIPLSSTVAAGMRDKDVLIDRRGGWLVVGARLRPDVTIETAGAELDVLAGTLAREYADPTSQHGLSALPPSAVPGNRSSFVLLLTLLMGLVSLILLVACANVSGVLLARGLARRQEMAVRLSLGAHRGRLARQLLTEAAVLVAIGTGLGLILTVVLTSYVQSWMAAAPFSIGLPFEIDARVLAFTCITSFVAALVSGLAPALQVSAAQPVIALKDESAGTTARLGFRRFFLVAQVALSLLLVIVAGLFAQTLLRATVVDPGFDARGIELTELERTIASAARLTPDTWMRALDSVRTLPGVEGAAMARVAPGGFEGIGLGIGAGGSDDFETDGNIVSPGYFGTLRIPIIDGRDFTSGDHENSFPVAIVGEGAARHFWPGESGLGKYLSQRVDGQERRYLVVGVVRDIKSTTLIDGISQSFIYVPLQQTKDLHFISTMILVTRAGGGRSLAAGVRERVEAAVPQVDVARAQTLEESVAFGLTPVRVAGSIAGGLGTVGLILAAVGLYGVIAFTVTRQRREFGIRMAMGARPSDIFRMVLWQGLAILSAGCAIGVVLAGLVSRVLSGAVLDAAGLGSTPYVGAIALFLAVGLSACYGPARRAVTVDVLDVLRNN